MKRVLITAFVGLVIASGAFAGEDCTTKEECPVATKVNALLVDWETAAEEARAWTPEQHAAFGSKVESVASDCPVGSRMKDTLTTVNDVLGFVVAMEEANAEHCPLESTECDAPEFAAAKRMKAGRAEMLRGLTKLAGYASGASCEKAAASCDVATVAAKDTKECAESASCPIRMASRIGELKASFADAKREALALDAQDRGELRARFASLSETSPAVALMPESVVALSEGLTALSELHGEMGAFAAEHPELMEKLPAEARQAFMLQVSLIDESRELLARATETMAVMMRNTDTAMR